MAEVTIQILGWNSGDELKHCCRQLKRVIPAGQAEYRYIDNGSSDGSAEAVKEILPECQVIELGENRGYAGGHNAGLTRCTTPFILLLNPDVILNWAGTRQVLSAFNDRQVASAQGLLYREMKEKIIDTAGIRRTLALNGQDRGAGQLDRGQFGVAEEVWAVSGAAGIYRIAALVDAALDGEFFDEDFFAYKEDVDLGWRLKNKGWKNMYIPAVQGSHSRTLRKERAGGWGGAIGRIRNALTWISFRNWIWMVMKNASWKELLIHEIFVDGRIMIFMAISVAYPPSWRIWGEIFRGAGRMLEKRKKTRYRTEQ